MKKRIGDMTLNEFIEHCKNRGWDRCARPLPLCELYWLCDELKDCSLQSVERDTLDREIEIND